MFSPQQRKRGTAASYAADEGGALSHEHWREEDGENENEKKKLASYRPCLVLAGLIILLVFLFSSGSLSLASVSRSSLSALEIKRRAEGSSSGGSTKSGVDGGLKKIVADGQEEVVIDVPLHVVDGLHVMRNDQKNPLEKEVVVINHPLKEGTSHLLPESAVVPVAESNSVSSLELKAKELIASLRQMKAAGKVMETDAEALSSIAVAQDAIRAYLKAEYGSPPYYLEMNLGFPQTMPDYVSAGKDGKIIVELAPIELVPYCVFYFLQVVKHFKSGAFHRNAGHVLQAMASVTSDGDNAGLAWQEYHPSYPHKRLTLGYAGRPGGPAFYISTVDNTDNHGPASQGSKSEADGCFGRVVEGEAVVLRMQKQPGKTKPSGFVDKRENFITINSLRLLNKGEYKIPRPKQ